MQISLFFFEIAEIRTTDTLEKELPAGSGQRPLEGLGAEELVWICLCCAGWWKGPFKNGDP